MSPPSEGVYGSGISSGQSETRCWEGKSTCSVQQMRVIGCPASSGQSLEPSSVPPCSPASMEMCFLPWVPLALMFYNLFFPLVITPEKVCQVFILLFSSINSPKLLNLSLCSIYVNPLWAYVLMYFISGGQGAPRGQRTSKVDSVGLWAVWECTQSPLFAGPSVFYFPLLSIISLHNRTKQHIVAVAKVEDQKLILHSSCINFRR